MTHIATAGSGTTRGRRWSARRGRGRGAALAVVAAALAVSGCGGPGLAATLDPLPPSETTTVSPQASPSAGPAEVAAPKPVPVVAATLPPVPRTRPAPTGLVIDDIRLSLPVTAVGLDASGDLAIPGTIRQVGWYRFGPRPGDPGTTILAAHVDTRREGLGPFARLRDLKPGAKVVVTGAGRHTVRFSVRAVIQAGKTSATIDRILADRSSSGQLALITCGGSYTRGRGYSDNIVVLAQPDATS